MAEKKILVVDDDPSIRYFLREAFTKSGYRVTCAGTGEEALRLVEAERFQVYFLDLKLPGINGLELCDAIKRRQSVSVIFAITGYASIFQLADCLKAGFHDYFTKPVDLGELCRATHSAFEKIDRWEAGGA